VRRSSRKSKKAGMTNEARPDVHEEHQGMHGVSPIQGDHSSHPLVMAAAVDVTAWRRSRPGSGDPVLTQTFVVYVPQDDLAPARQRPGIKAPPPDPVHGRWRRCAPPDPQDDSPFGRRRRAGHGRKTTFFPGAGGGRLRLAARRPCSQLAAGAGPGPQDTFAPCT
jgi:hypothetical protein